MITGKNWDNVEQVLVFEKTNEIVKMGEVVTTGKGELVTVIGGKAPHTPASTGRIWVRGANGTVGQSEFFPNVCGMKWRNLNDAY